MKISQATWSHHRGNYDGLCIACGEWSTGGVEPDAEGYECLNPECGERRVMGAEVVLFEETVELVDEEQSHE
jgi:hypothetical protein